MVYRREHPNPQWKRNNWENLNGIWEFDFDFSASGLERDIFKTEKLSKEINVPFCPESELSGIGYKDFINACCYRREVEITKDKLEGRVILHFGAVDYKTTLYINQQFVGEHFGGYTSFEFDITEFVTEGKNIIFLYVEDDVRSGLQCGGKQSGKVYSSGCYYTRTTGIWQTVWLEFVPSKYIKSAKYYPNINDVSLGITGVTCGNGKVVATAYFDGKEVGKAEGYSDGNFFINLRLLEKHLWEVGKGGLYDLVLTFEDDAVSSYFGLRNIAIDGYKVLINGETVFQRLVLDQGFYPDGIYTAQTEEELVKDIYLSLDAGFNGARLHEKVFEPLFLYHADRLGYMVWGEYPNWMYTDYNDAEAMGDLVVGWKEAVERDFNHPSIVGWCPLNEFWDTSDPTRIVNTLFMVTKALDSTRPCIDTSGGIHCHNYDIYDFHSYIQDVDEFTKMVEEFGETGEYGGIKEQDGFKWFCFRNRTGVPFFISEYGGIKWDVTQFDNNVKVSWGYGDAPKTIEEFVKRYKGLTEALLNNKNMFGFCYTQLYDVEQERNGLYTYDRKPKLDMDIIKKINCQKAKIE